jgi:hypothetical protein
MSPVSFIERWLASSASELANTQTFLSELCDVLGVERPHPAVAEDERNQYTFEKRVEFLSPDGSTFKRIDLYKRASFILESKQGGDDDTEKPARKGTAKRNTKGWDDAMYRAKNQAERYARNLPTYEGRPPFLIVIDVGYSFELYSEFSRTGGIYQPFPDPQNYRIFLKDLLKEETRTLLRTVWIEPLSLDPAKRSAKVTREIAGKLAILAKSLEKAHPANEVASFLMRFIFTMFAEDMELLPKGKFADLLESLTDNPSPFPDMLESLWQTMNTGGFSPIFREKLLQFNGGLFADSKALPVNKEQLGLLIEATKADWRDVEPAIFGTLLERALDEHERHKLGAHYTPRAYVERLVIPTIMEPLREQWQNVLVEVQQQQQEGNLKNAIGSVEKFHAHLCNLKILDPACGSGNFLYVTLELMKRLEGEVLDTLKQLGGQDARLDMAGATVDPHQFLGIEVNPRAAKIAELVLWIGYLQWHYRTRGNIAPPAPILRDFHNIENRDAVLAYDAVEKVVDKDGKAITRWDGRSFKKHPVTGEDVPDETAKVQELKYLNPRKADWPEADYIVGNPPFIGAKYMRDALGDGYAKTVRDIHDDVPESADFVMYWWNHAAELVRGEKAKRFGFIATNSLKQTFNRRILQTHLDAKNPLSIAFAIPDHPWVDSADGAAVRISMTVGEAGTANGVLQNVISELDDDVAGEANVELSSKQGKIQPDLTIGANVAGALPLKANEGISSPGVKLHGAGFIVTPEEAKSLGLGRIQGLEKHIRQYLNGRDLNAIARNVMVIDLFGLTAKDVLEKFPEVYQWVQQRVKPERDNNNRATYRDNWWTFGEARSSFRPALQGLSRYIATVVTSKHRLFTFLSADVLPDDALINIAIDDAYFLGVLSSRSHVVWSQANASSIGVYIGNVRYNKTRCFDPFPFPTPTDSQKSHIRQIAEQLDTHRKSRQTLHPTLTLTDMYNVLEKLRAFDLAPLNKGGWGDLTDKDKKIHEQGLVSVLGELHDELDKAVAEAYGWPSPLSDEEILERLVALNAERATEEKRGLIRYLRPEYQAKGQNVQAQMLEVEETEVVASTEKPVFPKNSGEQVQAVRVVLKSFGRPVAPLEVARAFKGAQEKKVRELLDILATLGQASEVEGRYSL